jgi:type III secretory pathway lipoprotein EscJ
VSNLTQHLQEKLTTEEKGELDSDVDSNKIVKVLKVLKSNKFPGEDGIISEFY